MYYRNNVIGSLGTLEAMAAEGCRLFVFSSSCAVYGEPDSTPITEDHPTRPVNAYGQTKLAVEQALPHFERAYGMRAVCLRYFNAAGADPDGQLGEAHAPRDPRHPARVRGGGGGPPLDVFGQDYATPDGTCLRDYVHVSDLAAAHVQALAHLARGGASATYNVGTETPTSVLEVMAAVERVTGRAVPHRLAPRRPGDPAVLFASAARIRRELGWTATRPALDTIVADAWRWHAEHPNGFGGK